MGLRRRGREVALHPHNATMNRGPRLSSITHVFGDAHLQRWRGAFEDARVNPFQARALGGFFGEVGFLIEARDALDEFRDTMPRSQIGRDAPNERQRERLYFLTKSFFDTYYSALSHLSSVLVRFSSIFGELRLTENRRLVLWLGGNLELVHHDVLVDVERSRLFRAVVNHPQQFPVVDWHTATDNENTNAHVVLHGPASRSGKIPPGATRHHPYVGEMYDWTMRAPDEVSATNSFAIAASECLFKILDSVLPGQSFRGAGASRAAAWIALEGFLPSALNKSG